MIRRPPRSTQSRSSAASDVYKRQVHGIQCIEMKVKGIAPPVASKLESKHAGLKYSDLIPKIYEGGYKVWECSVDLLEYLALQQSLGFSKQRVLELGCGQGLPGIWALLNGAQVVFQDFNAEVLEEATLPCVLHNIASNGLNKDEVLPNANFVSGDWSELPAKIGDTFDLILTSETIYNTEYYESLHSALEKMLKKEGRVLLAAKRYYYGNGGGVDSFLDFVEAKGVFDYEVSCTIDKGMSNIRNILTLRFK
eukprot:TRINITY_DN8344_c0_g4_i1.p1 TRINITY_DN8344_c0_g4~~TRINITY_DN8344_c0_g4_i1.p1  ORF type:complete len:259 (-),score=64.05 TRINITY_DN8344_c0_g4_i1:125-880(-)